MSSSFVWIRAALLLVLVLRTPVLATVSAIRACKAKQRSSYLAPLLIAAAAVANWLLFVSFLLTDQFNGAAFHYLVSELATTLLIITMLLVVVSVCVQADRWILLTCNLVVLLLWFAFAYSPQHWFGHALVGTASIGDRTIPAIMYIANPRESEAESIALVHVPDVGDYFIDFRDETFREASKLELVPLHYGVWTWRAAPSGMFPQPLPFREVNQTRIGLADGHVLSIDF